MIRSTFPHETCKVAFKELLDLDLVETRVTQHVYDYTWEMSFKFRWGDDGSYRMVSMRRELRKGLPLTLESMMDVAAELVHYHIERRFPNSVRIVKLEKDEAAAMHRVTVFFRNGHQLSALAPDAFKDDFMAQVAMVWDLPQYVESKE